MARKEAQGPQTNVGPPLNAGRSLLGRIEAVVVTFNSGPGIFELWPALATELDGLVIVDNGSPAELVTGLRQIADAQSARVRLIANAANRGLAAAQNQGIEAALQRGADWVLLLDDDSMPQSGFCTALAEGMAQAVDSQRIALLAPAIRQPQEAGETRYWTMRGRWRATHKKLGGAVEADALFVIASGSLVSAAALRALGLMREDFFIDYVDVEFGLRLRRAGWRILLVPGAVLEHRLGNPRRHSLGGWSVKSTNHEPARRFTIFRNRVRLWRAYLVERPGWVLADVAAAAADLLRILCFEKSKRAKLGSALRGLWQGTCAPPLG